MRNLDEISEIMAYIPEDWRLRWCRNYEGCGCLGCVNGSGIGKLMQVGKKPEERITEQEWKYWMEQKHGKHFDD